MQVPLPQQVLWQPMMTSAEHYVTAAPPVPSMVFPQTLAHGGLISVPLVLKNGWVVQGIPQAPHQPAYVPQPLHYVAVQPRMVENGGLVEKQATVEAFNNRSLLVPRGPTRGSDVIASGRTLCGSSFAARRQSEENCDDTPVKRPSVEDRILPKKEVLCNKDRDNLILQSIEYYFSDENLSKNAYLLKQVMQENGFVSIKRVSALKRVKMYTRNDHVVAQCIRQSDKLELNEDGTMVRRKEPLPANIEPPRFVRSVIAINLPMEMPTIEAVTVLFASYGDLTQVRILKPGKNLPSYLVDYQAWIPDLGKKYCALVEFESQDEAQNACREINMKNRTLESLRVALLKPGARLRRTLYRKYKGNEDNMQSSDAKSGLQSEKRSLKPDHDPSLEYDASCSGSSSESDSQPMKNDLNPQRIRKTSCITCHKFSNETIIENPCRNQNTDPQNIQAPNFGAGSVNATEEKRVIISHEMLQLNVSPENGTSGQNSGSKKPS